MLQGPSKDYATDSRSYDWFTAAVIPTKYVKKKKIIILRQSDSAPLQLIPKKCEELKKHQMNIRTLLSCSNATPIRKLGRVGYMCCFCAREFPEPGLLKSHTRRMHESALPSYASTQTMTNFMVKLDITDLQCLLCNSSFNTVEDIAGHLTTNHKKMYHKDIRSHILPFSFKKDFSCVICSIQFSNFKVLLEHMNEHFKNYACDVCDKGYVNRSQYNTHMYRHKIGVFTCSFCSKVFDTRVKWRSHERGTHVLMNKRSKCGYCGEKFKDYTKKRSHEAEVHGAARVVIQCRACERNFSSQRALNVHTKNFHLMERKVPK